MQAQYGFHINQTLKNSLLLCYLSLHSLRSFVRLTQFPSTMAPDLATVGADDFRQATYKAQPSQCSCSPCNTIRRRSFTHHHHIRGNLHNKLKCALQVQESQQRVALTVSLNKMSRDNDCSRNLHPPKI